MDAMFDGDGYITKCTLDYPGLSFRRFITHVLIPTTVSSWKALLLTIAIIIEATLALFTIIVKYITSSENIIWMNIGILVMIFVFVYDRSIAIHRQYMERFVRDRVLAEVATLVSNRDDTNHESRSTAYNKSCHSDRPVRVVVNINRASRIIKIIFPKATPNRNKDSVATTYSFVYDNFPPASDTLPEVKYIVNLR